MENTIEDIVEKLGVDCDADGKAQLREKLLLLDNKSSGKCSRASKSHKSKDGKSLGEVISKDLFCWAGTSLGDAMNEAKREKIKYLSFEWGVETAKLKKDKSNITITIEKNRWDTLADRLRKSGIPYTWKSGEVGEIVIKVRSEDLMDAIDMAKSMNAIAEDTMDPTHTDSMSVLEGSRHPQTGRLAQELDTAIVSAINSAIVKFHKYKTDVVNSRKLGDYDPVDKDELVYHATTSLQSFIKTLRASARRGKLHKFEEVDEDDMEGSSLDEVAGKKRNPHHRKLADKLDTTLVKNIDSSIKRFMDIEEVLFATLDSEEYNPLSKDRILFDAVDGPTTHLKKLKVDAKKQMVRKSRSPFSIT